MQGPFRYRGQEWPQSGDKIKVTVYGEETLTGEYDINPSGYVSMPLIGAIRAAGRTQSEFGRDVANRYRRDGLLQGNAPCSVELYEASLP